MRMRSGYLILILGSLFSLFCSSRVQAQASSASFVRADSATGGNWHGTYGADGYSLVGDTESVPSYATFAVQNQAEWTWSGESSDLRALQTGGGVGRLAATWYNSPSFSFDVNFTDGNSHQFALYTIDWDSLGRAETVQVLDATTQAVLNAQSVSGFGNGVYLVWNISGHVKVNVIGTSGPNAVVSGAFFGGNSAITSMASFVRSDSSTEGNWHGAYGADGYSVASDSQNVPSYATLAIQNQAGWTYSPESTDVRALQTGSGVGRIAATWYNSPAFSFDVNFTDGNSHQFALYAIDWDSLGRAETVQVLDATTEAVLNTQSISSISNGVYLVWNISGHVKINVIGTGGPNAAVSGVFFGGSSSIPSATNFVRSDTTTQGNWHGMYGADGYSVANDSQSIPSYASFAVQNQAAWTWSLETTDVRALEAASGVGRIAATWYNSPAFTFDVNFTDGNSHQLALYAVDWDPLGRAETIQVLDAATEAILDTRSISGFTNGVYLVWNLSGHVKINVIGTGAPNAVVSGVFFGGSNAITSVASFVRSDSTTGGNWHGAYGANGYSVASDSQNVPSYATLAIQNQAGWTYSSESTDVRALQTGSGVGRIAATWYNSPAFSFDVNFTDGNSHQFALYAIDWDSLGRAETVQVLDAGTEAILDTENLSAFTTGTYLVWNISGHVRINVIGTGGPNAVISGVFFGGSSPVTSTASFVRSDSTTLGTWHGSYGADGYSVSGDAQSVPSYATFAIQDEAGWTWDSSSTDIRALQTGSGPGRIAATWYNSPSFSFDVNFKDGNSHQFALYAVDWDNLGRADSIQILDATTEAVLNTQNIAAFSNGVYLVWNISGHVKINVVDTGNPNAVISGVFWDPVPGSGGTGPALQSVSIAPSNPSLVLSSSQPLQFSLTGAYSDGSFRGLTSIANWSTSNNSVAQLVPNPNLPGVVIPISSGTANITATYNNLNASTTVTVLAPPPPSNPTITSVSPTTGDQGTQVAIRGSGFGASQGTGYVVLGSTLGTVISWSDAQIFATVASGSTSGAVQVQQAGVSSNTLPFTVNTATITSVTPRSGGSGAQVTITGSGFGAAQGNGMVVLGTTLGQVISWNDAQVVASVTTGSNSGMAQVLQNGVWSNSVAFTVTDAPPHITSINPNTGSAGTLVTIRGTGFGPSQGSGNASIGATPASVNTWSDTQISATVGSSAISGIAKIQQNGLWSNAVTFTVPSSSGTGGPLTLNPNVLTMVVGDTHSIQALGSNSQPIPGLTWTSSDTTIVKLSSDDPPILAAVAPGTATITAGGASADVTVYGGSALPLGTVIWSTPGDGSGVSASGIVPAVPSASGTDVFAKQADCNVQAIRSDGYLAWTSNIGMRADGLACKNFLPDFQGGFVVLDSGFTQKVNGVNVVTPGSIQKFDGMTGQPYGAHSVADPRIPNFAVVHTDGTIFSIDGDSLVAVDPTTGNEKFSVKMEHSVFSDPECPYDRLPTIHSNPMIAGDGYMYLLYDYLIGSGQGSCYCLEYLCQPGKGANTHFEWHARVLRVGTGGDSSKIDVGDSTEDWNYNQLPSIPVAGGWQDEYVATVVGQIPQIVEPQRIITNGDQGVLLPLYAPTPASCAFVDVTTDPGAAGPTTTSVYGGCVPAVYNYKLTTISGTSMTSQVTLPNNISYLEPDLQAQDGTYFGVVDYAYGPYDDFLAKFDAAGNIQWSVPGYYAQIATADGGVVAQTWDGSSTVTFDASGNATGQFASSPGQSWTGESYEPSGGSLSNIAQLPFDVDVTSYAATAGGNPSQNNTAVPECPCEIQSGTTSTASNFTFPKPQFANDFSTQTSLASPRLMLASYPPHRGALTSPHLTLRNRATLTPQSGGGNQATDLLLVGEPGETGNAFEAAAQTVATVANLYATNPPNPANKSLIASGDSVIPGNPAANPAFPNPYFIQVFDVSDVATQLTKNNLITGQVMLFMHGGTNHAGQSGLFPNQTGGRNGNGPNISDATVGMLQSAAAYLGPKTTVTLYACHGGRKGKNGNSIAQELANTLKVPVYAWKAGMFFDPNPNTTAISTCFNTPNKTCPIFRADKPLYMIPWGGVGVPPCQFKPNTNEPEGCGGNPLSPRGSQ